MKTTNWSTPMIITNKATWSPYIRDDANMLFLCASIEIGIEKVREQAYCKAYKNATDVAELFWKNTHKIHVIMYREKTEYTNEGFFIYTKLN